MPEAIEKVFGAIAGGSSALNLLEASRAPAATDDETKGFSAGSVWFKKSTGDWWTCTSAAASAATWEELTFGGGGGAFPETNLVALFKDAGENYDSGVWTASNDETMELDNITNVTVDGNNRLANDGAAAAWAFNSALRAALDDEDDMTFVFGFISSNNSGNGFVLNEANGLFNNTVNMAAGVTGNTLSLTCGRDNYAAGLAVTASNTILHSTFYVCRGFMPRNDTMYVQIDANAKATGDTLDDNPIDLYTSSSSTLGTASVTIGVGFMAVYNGEISDADWAALLAAVSGSAEFGNA